MAALVSDGKKAASYVSKAFVPMVQAIHDYPNVVCANGVCHEKHVYCE